jgi:hypothetical protein
MAGDFFAISEYFFTGIWARQFSICPFLWKLAHLISGGK